MVAMNEVMYEVMHDYVRIIHRYAMSVKDQLEMQHIDGEWVHVLKKFMYYIYTNNELEEIKYTDPYHTISTLIMN